MKTYICATCGAIHFERRSGKDRRSKGDRRINQQPLQYQSEDRRSSHGRRTINWSIATYDRRKS